MAEVLENWVPGGPLTEPGPESVRKGGRDEGWRGREREEKVGRMSREDWQGGREKKERREEEHGGRGEGGRERGRRVEWPEKETMGCEDKRGDWKERARGREGPKDR